MSRPICLSFDDTCPYCKRSFYHMKEEIEETGENQLNQCDEWIDEEDEEDV